MKTRNPIAWPLLLLTVLIASPLGAQTATDHYAPQRVAGSNVDAGTYPSLQAAIDANPGKIIRIPDGEYHLDQALVVKNDRTELRGPARIVQTNPKVSLIRVIGATGVRIDDLTFTRAEGRQETTEHGVYVSKSRNIMLSRLHVSENHTRSSIVAEDSFDVIIENCTVTNFKGVTIDDRTAPHHLSDYAFRSIDGTGIQLRAVDGGVIRDSRVQELRLLPTKEIHDQYKLGQLTIVPKKPGRLMSEEIFRTHYTNNWHQGAGIHVTNPIATKRVIIAGNYVEHAPQGIDIHADNVVVTGNIISHAMIGMKSMHGSKNVLIDGNQFTYIDLWGIKLMTGNSSRAAGQPNAVGAISPENVDGGHIISNNIVSNFGLGLQNWNWEGREANRAAIILPAGQLEENPPLRSALVIGNVVYDSGRDQVLVDGKWTVVPPRYNWALYVETSKKPIPQNVKLIGNLLDPGRLGTTNLPENQ